MASMQEPPTHYQPGEVDEDQTDGECRQPLHLPAVWPLGVALHSTAAQVCTGYCHWRQHHKAGQVTQQVVAVLG